MSNLLAPLGVNASEVPEAALDETIRMLRDGGREYVAAEHRG
jgi:hypothetical protein